METTANIKLNLHSKLSFLGSRNSIWASFYALQLSVLPCRSYLVSEHPAHTWTSRSYLSLPDSDSPASSDGGRISTVFVSSSSRDNGLLSSWLVTVVSSQSESLSLLDEESSPPFRLALLGITVELSLPRPAGLTECDPIKVWHQSRVELFLLIFLTLAAIYSGQGVAATYCVPISSILLVPSTIKNKQQK